MGLVIHAMLEGCHAGQFVHTFNDQPTPGHLMHTAVYSEVARMLVVSINF